jgi:hypothetical protein
MELPDLSVNKSHAAKLGGAYGQESRFAIPRADGGLCLQVFSQETRKSAKLILCFFSFE